MPQGSPPQLRRIGDAELQHWFDESSALDAFFNPLGLAPPAAAFLDATLQLPLPLRVVLQARAKEGLPLSVDSLASIPFYSLCRGLFLPLEALHPDKVAQIFGLKLEDAPLPRREELLATFLQKELGLELQQKVACVLGDPFFGGPATLRRDSLLSLLLSLELSTRRALLDRLTQAGDIAVLFAQSRPSLQVSPPLTAAEVLECLRVLPSLRRRLQFDVLRALLARMGKLEAYYLARLILRKAGVGREDLGLIGRGLAAHFAVPPEEVSAAIALADPFRVARVLEAEGREGLRQIRLQPLTAVRPSLAGGTTEDISRFPVWVERKYDGIRLLAHRDTDARGNVLCGAYTRNTRDWLELIPGLNLSLKLLPAMSAILDGELYGTVLDLEGVRPATVYEVYATIQGENPGGVSLRYAAFDLLYLNGQDLTRLPLAERRQRLTALLAPLANANLPLSIVLVEGQLAQSKDDVNRLYQHFRNQGYEGVITKRLDAPYLLAARDPDWCKRKPLVTLDLVLLGAVLAVTTKQRAGTFGSYVIGARQPDGSFLDVGDVAGVDQARDRQISEVIMREGLLTGRRIERQSSSGVRPGFELRPYIVVTVKFEGITKDFATGELKLRDPKLLQIRADKSAAEADSSEAFQELYLRQRVG